MTQGAGRADLPTGAAALCALLLACPAVRIADRPRGRPARPIGHRAAGLGVVELQRLTSAHGECSGGGRPVRWRLGSAFTVVGRQLGTRQRQRQSSGDG